MARWKKDGAAQYRNRQRPARIDGDAAFLGFFCHNPTTKGINASGMWDVHAHIGFSCFCFCCGVCFFFFLTFLRGFLSPSLASPLPPLHDEFSCPSLVAELT